MTNDEAIKVLEADKVYLYPDECYNSGAYDRAIKAFEFINENFPSTFEDYFNGEHIW